MKSILCRNLFLYLTELNLIRWKRGFLTNRSGNACTLIPRRNKNMRIKNCKNTLRNTLSILVSWFLPSYTTLYILPSYFIKRERKLINFNILLKFCIDYKSTIFETDILLLAILTATTETSYFTPSACSSQNTDGCWHERALFPLLFFYKAEEPSFYLSFYILTCFPIYTYTYVPS